MQYLEGMNMGLLSKLFGATKNQMEDRSGYGSLIMPPSAEAMALQTALTEEEKSNFIGILQHMQEWYESGTKERPVSFHPEARARFWGLALSKIADHYHDIGRNDKALFFVSSAWNISQHPFFAYNLAMLWVDAGDLKGAQPLLETFLAQHQDMLTSPLLKLVTPDMTEGEVENMAKSARATLASIKSQMK